MSDLVKEVTESSFSDEVLSEGLPVLVDFWADWCGPCKMIAPVLEEVAGVYQGKMKICKIDVDKNSEIGSKYGVRGIPTLILFKGGNVEDTKVGALSRAQMVSFIEAHI